MQPPIGFADSVQPGNAYTFDCPIVGREARFVMCAFKRSKYMRGQSFQDGDCKCAMIGGKCPVEHMLRMEWNEGEILFTDKTDKVHKLVAKVWERIQRIVLLPFHAAGLDLSADQKKRLFDPDMSDVAPLPNAKPKRRAKAGVKDNLTDGLGEIDSDMSSLINNAVNVE